MEMTKRYEVRAVGGMPGKRAPAELLAGYDSFEAAAAVAKREANRFPRGTCVLDTETGLVDYGVGDKSGDSTGGAVALIIAAFLALLPAACATAPRAGSLSLATVSLVVEVTRR